MSTTFALRASDLRAALQSAVRASAKESEHVPAISGVYLDAVGHSLRVVGTNRYVLVAARAGCREVADGGDGVILKRSDVPAAVKLLTAAKSAEVDLVITPDAISIRVAGGDAIAFTPLNDHYPNLVRMFDGADKVFGEPLTAQGLGSSVLAVLGGIKVGSWVLGQLPGKNKPIVARGFIGDAVDVLALVMPVRMDGSEFAAAAIAVNEMLGYEVAA